MHSSICSLLSFFFFNSRDAKKIVIIELNVIGTELIAKKKKRKEKGKEIESLFNLQNLIVLIKKSREREGEEEGRH